VTINKARLQLAKLKVAISVFLSIVRTAPIAGRMLSPDNYVQDPTNLHNFNRYSYVMNNPLKYADPSGQILKYVAACIKSS